MTKVQNRFALVQRQQMQSELLERDHVKTDFLARLVRSFTGRITAMVTLKHFFIGGTLLSLIWLALTSNSTVAVVEGKQGYEGWYVSDVEVRWYPPTDAVVQSGCRNTVIDYDTAGTELSCTYRNGTEDPVTETVVIKRDTTPPTPVLNVPLDEPLFVEEGIVFRLDGSNSTDNLSSVNFVIDRNQYAYADNPLLVSLPDGQANGTPSSAIVWLLWDEAGNETKVMTEVLVQNVPPEVQPLEYTAFADGWVTLDVFFQDPGVEEIHLVTIDWGDGVVEETTMTYRNINIRHKYSDPNAAYLVTVTVADDDGGVGEASHTIIPAQDAIK